MTKEESKLQMHKAFLEHINLEDLSTNVNTNRYDCWERLMCGEGQRDSVKTKQKVSHIYLRGEFPRTYIRALYED